MPSGASLLRPQTALDAQGNERTRGLARLNKMGQEVMIGVGECCWVQGYHCANDQPTGIWVRLNDVKLAWAYGYGTHCIYFKPPANPCPPSKTPIADLQTFDGGCPQCIRDYPPYQTPLGPIPCDVDLSKLCNFVVVIDGVKPRLCRCPVADPATQLCPPWNSVFSIITSLAGANGAYQFARDPVSGLCQATKGGGEVTYYVHRTPGTNGCDEINVICRAHGYRMIPNFGAPGLVHSIGLNVGTPGPPAAQCKGIPVGADGITALNFKVACRNGVWEAGRVDPVKGWQPGKAFPTGHTYGDINVGIFA